jgi:cytidine deaminase
MMVQGLTDEDRELIELARRTVDANTDGPDGVYTMGAAVRGVDGRMYAGINLYHFTGGPCAELVALGRARAEGARELTTIVAVGNEGRTDPARSRSPTSSPAPTAGPRPRSRSPC